MSDSDFDDVAHETLLQSIATPGSVKKKKLKQTKPGKIDATSLLSHIKVARTATALAKKSLGIGQFEDDDKEVEEDEKKPKNKRKRDNEDDLEVPGKKTKRVKTRKSKTLVPERDQEARKKVEAAIGFQDLKKEMTSSWRDLVDSNRIADQLIFPLQPPDALSFKDDDNDTQTFTKEELEIRKAMDIKMAKDKIRQMQRMRALVSQQEAKHRYQAKIKSKGYHRILKREKRKQLLKEFDELVMRDPAAAQEKLAELDKQRVVERGELKHRARNKFQQLITKHADKNPAVKKMLEEHLRLGRELKQKVSMDSDSEGEKEDGQDDKKKTMRDILEDAAKEAADESQEKEDIGKRLVDAFLDDPSSVKAKISLLELRAQKRHQALARNITAQNVSEPTFEVDGEWQVVKSEDTADAKDKKKKKKGKKAKSETEESKPDTLTKEETAVLSEYERKLLAAVEAAGVNDEDDKEDVSIDPKKFLELTTSSLTQVSSDFVEKMDEFDHDVEQQKVISEAFKDDDVIGDFEEIKDEVTERERPKDVDVTLMGWGSWVGPGVSQKQKRRQFIVKAKEKKRKDGGRLGVIIREGDAQEAVGKLQPRSLPFPYTRVEDYEAVLKQPLGLDWNPARVRDDLCKKQVVVEAGRAILPINKKMLMGEK